MLHTLNIDLPKLINDSGLSVAEIARRSGMPAWRIYWFTRTRKPGDIERALEVFGTVMKTIQDERPDLVEESDTFKLTPVQAAGQE